jgi:hypothetical protein
MLFTLLISDKVLPTHEVWHCKRQHQTYCIVTHPNQLEGLLLDHKFFFQRHASTSLLASYRSARSICVSNSIKTFRKYVLFDD